jgi:surface protein
MDESDVRNMKDVFDDASTLNQDIGSWDVSNVTDRHVSNVYGCM